MINRINTGQRKNNEWSGRSITPLHRIVTTQIFFPTPQQPERILVSARHAAITVDVDNTFTLAIGRRHTQQITRVIQHDCIVLPVLPIF